MKAFFIIGVLFLPSCVNLLPPPSSPPEVAVLSPVFEFSPALKAVKWSLAVEKPLAASPYDSRRLILNVKNDKGLAILKPLANIEWSESFPLLLQQNLISAFEHSKKITGVGQEEENFSSHFALQVNIKNSEIVLLKSNHQHLFLNLSVKLISKRNYKVITQHIFKREYPIKERTLNAFIYAYEKVLGEVLSEIVIWTLREGSVGIVQTR
jgi:cholesterol transport system auxiliary component